MKIAKTRFQVRRGSLLTRRVLSREVEVVVPVVIHLASRLGWILVGRVDFPKKDAAAS